jgi:hypothetical protein
MKPIGATDSGAALREAVERYRASKPDTAEPLKPAKGPRQPRWGPISEISGYPLNDMHSRPPEPPPVHLEAAPGGPQLRKVVRDTPSTTTEPMEPIADMEPHPITDAAPATEDDKAKPTTDWRDLIKVHPAADVFPMFSPEALAALVDDIKVNGLKLPIEAWLDADGTEWLIDGRNRCDAMQVAGYRFIRKETTSGEWTRPEHLIIYEPASRKTVQVRLHGGDPVALVKSFNEHRRHMTTDERRAAIGRLLKVDPEKSDRAIAAMINASDKTVGAKRAAMEASAEIPQLKTRTGADGKTRKTKKTAPNAPAGEPKPATEAPQAPEPTNVISVDFEAKNPEPVEQPKVVTTDDLRTWIDLKPALPMSELFTALWDCMSGGERLTVHELVASDAWRSSRPRAIDRQPQQNRP